MGFRKGVTRRPHWSHERHGFSLTLIFPCLQQIRLQTPFSPEDIARIMQCRGEHHRPGFAYQLAFVRSPGRFPAQEPLEIEEDIVAFASVQ